VYTRQPNLPKGDVKMSQNTKRGPGRPPVYTGKTKTHMLSLIRKHGLTGARNRLTAGPRSPLRAERNTDLIPKAMKVTLVTLCKFAKDAGIALQAGRPKGTGKLQIAAKAERAAQRAARKARVVSEPAPTTETVAEVTAQVSASEAEAVAQAAA